MVCINSREYICATEVLLLPGEILALVTAIRSEYVELPSIEHQKAIRLSSTGKMEDLLLEVLTSCTVNLEI